MVSRVQTSFSQVVLNPKSLTEQILPLLTKTFKIILLDRIRSRDIPPPQQASRLAKLQSPQCQELDAVTTAGEHRCADQISLWTPSCSMRGLADGCSESERWKLSDDSHGNLHFAAD
jgi:hypothetical protein